MSIEKIDTLDASKLTPAQTEGLKRLHQAAQQMEALFTDMLFKEMRKSAPPVTWDGKKQSSAQGTWQEMLDSKRSQSMAETGAGLGIARILEDQLRDAVLSAPETAASAKVKRSEDGP